MCAALWVCGVQCGVLGAVWGAVWGALGVGVCECRVGCLGCGCLRVPCATVCAGAARTSQGAA